jgi:hypothetical protein
MADTSRSGKGEMNRNRAGAGPGGGGIGGKLGSADLKKRSADNAAAGDSSARPRSTKSGADMGTAGGGAQTGATMSGTGSVQDTSTRDVPSGQLRGKRKQSD